MSPLRSLEVAYGLAVGRDERTHALSRAPGDPRGAMRDVLRRALERPPCVISFSGGLDSSALLALATQQARERSLPDPVPATLVFRESSASDEEDWQRLVLDHLGLAEDTWLRFELTDELDAVGEVAQQVLRRHGLFWPFNLHFHQPIIEAAAGGTVVTGFGGDELGRSSAGLAAERKLRGRGRHDLRAVAHLGYRLGPSGLRWGREAIRAREQLDELPWLRPPARRRLRLAVAQENTHPFGWDRLLRHVVWRSRYFQVCRHNFQVMADPHRVRMVHPFVEPEVLARLGADGRWAGLGGRRGIWTYLFEGLVPEALLRRETKAAFDDPLWTPRALAFAESWSGQGLDERYVDPTAVRAHWLSSERSVMSTTMLQAAWLADHG